METIIEHNSSKNQEIKGKFVQREVYLNMNGWVEDYQKNNECWFDEMQNLYLSDQQILDNDTYYTNKMNDEEKEEYIQSIKDNGEDIQEIFEYWAVSSFLYEDLKKLGEPVAEINNTYIWGRTCTGQAILLDSVISNICEGMEILEGQSNSWE